jgi:hypothetical protein
MVFDPFEGGDKLLFHTGRYIQRLVPSLQTQEPHAGGGGVKNLQSITGPRTALRRVQNILRISLNILRTFSIVACARRAPTWSNCTSRFSLRSTVWSRIPSSA